MSRNIIDIEYFDSHKPSIKKRAQYIPKNQNQNVDFISFIFSSSIFFILSILSPFQPFGYIFFISISFAAILLDSDFQYLYVKKSVLIYSTKFSKSQPLPDFFSDILHERIEKIKIVESEQFQRRGFFWFLKNGKKKFAINFLKKKNPLFF